MPDFFKWTHDIVISLVVENTWKSGDDIVFEKELLTVADYILNNRLWNTVTISSFNKEIGLKEKENHIHPCGNPMYVFDNKGLIYTCVRFVDFSLRSKPARIIGNIKDGIDYNKLRPLRAFDRESAYPQECLDCEISSCCRWCPTENYDSSDLGTVFMRTTTVCALHKANLRVKNYYFNNICYLEQNERQ